MEMMSCPCNSPCLDDRSDWVKLTRPDPIMDLNRSVVMSCMLPDD
jgi:hypothetical protein